MPKPSIYQHRFTFSNSQNLIRIREDSYLLQFF
jgi:hypothetical protein